MLVVGGLGFRVGWGVILFAGCLVLNGWSWYDLQRDRVVLILGKKLFVMLVVFLFLVELESILLGIDHKAPNKPERRTQGALHLLISLPSCSDED